MFEKAAIDSGWVQVNNTVVPYVRHQLPNGMPVQLVPLPVIQHGAGLLRDVYVQTTSATEAERGALNARCARAGLNFTFEGDVQLMALYELVARYKSAVAVTFLPKDDPLASARFHGDVRRRSTSGSVEIQICAGAASEDDGRPADVGGGAVPPTSTAGGQPAECALDLSNKGSAANERSPATERLKGDKEDPIDLTQKEAHVKERRSGSRACVMSADQIKAVSVPQERWRQLPADVDVVPMRVHGHVIPSVVKGDVHFVLVETIRKAYFASCSLNAFMHVVRRYVGPFVYDLGRDDVRAIRRFARNPSCLNRCSKVISLWDANRLIPPVRRFLDRVRSRVKHQHDVGAIPDKSNGPPRAVQGEA